MSVLSERTKIRPMLQPLRHAKRKFSIGSSFTIDSVNAVATGALIATGLDPSLRSRMEDSVAAVDQAVENGQIIYGVTTGFGGMAGQEIDCALASQLQQNLLQFLAAGAGAPISSIHTRAAMLARASVLVQGKSGIRFELVERLLRFLNEGFTPIVRELGSIGASGDLVPLSCIARAITGSGKSRIDWRGETLGSDEALKHLGLEPVKLRPKEGLALVNGTSFSSAIAANSTFEAKRLFAISMAAQSMMMRALLVQTSPFEDFVHQAKPHPGQVWTARLVRQLLTEGAEPIDATPEVVQDRYSLRCMPQYTGAIAEGLARVQRTVETEMNAVSDNPLIDVETGDFYQSGNFLGQYISIAMDDLRRFIGLLAKHLDVQIATLVAPEFNGGLSPSLLGNPASSFNMGLKGLQICGNSIMPMLTHAANPIAEHFPTHAEQFNQNINGLSWGSANLAWKSVELFQQYTAVSLIFAVQALDLRAKQVFGHFDGRRLLGTKVRSVYEAVCEAVEADPGEAKPFLYDDADRWLEQDVERLAAAVASHDSSLAFGVQPILDSFNEHFEVSQ